MIIQQNRLTHDEVKLNYKEQKFLAHIELTFGQKFGRTFKSNVIFSYANIYKTILDKTRINQNKNLEKALAVTFARTGCFENQKKNSIQKYFQSFPFLLHNFSKGRMQIIWSIQRRIQNPFNIYDADFSRKYLTVFTFYLFRTPVNGFYFKYTNSFRNQSPRMLCEILLQAYCYTRKTSENVKLYKTFLDLKFPKDGKILALHGN